MNSPIKKILVNIDGTEQSITAAQYAIVLAKYLQAELNAIYVINTKALEDLVRAHIFLKEEQSEYERDLREDAIRYLKHVAQLGRKKGIEIKTHSAEGSGHKEILNFVKENEIDLLVVGEISSIRSRRDEFYDETERAIRAVPCSVLIVKDEDKVWELYETL